MKISAPLSPAEVGLLAKAGLDAYVRNITGHQQFIMRVMPQKVKARAGSPLWNTWQAARRTIELYRTLSLQTKRHLSPLFHIVQESYLDWFRSAFQTRLQNPQVVLNIPYEIFSSANPNPVLFNLHFISKKPFQMWISEKHPRQNPSIDVVERSKKGVICMHRRFHRELSTTFQEHWMCGPNSEIVPVLRRDTYYAFCFQFPSAIDPQPSIFPIIIGQLLSDLL